MEMKFHKIVDSIIDINDYNDSARPLKTCAAYTDCCNLTPLEFCDECYADQLFELTGEYQKSGELLGLIREIKYKTQYLFEKLES